MIDINIISSAMTSGAGTNLYAYNAAIDLKYGADQAQPSITQSMSVGEPWKNGSTVLFPCQLNLVLTYTRPDGTVIRVQNITEKFTVGTSATSLPATYKVTDLGARITLSKKSCCKFHQANIEGSFSLVTT